MLEAHPDALHVLEDVESLCRSPNAAGVLRSALWTANKDKGGKGRQERLITWAVAGDHREVFFTGGIIMSMNAPLDDLPELRAVKTRICVAKLEPTQGEIAALMKSICFGGYRTRGEALGGPECLVVYEFIKQTCDNVGKNYDLRMLINGFRDLMQWKAGHSESHWQDLLSSRLRERVVIAHKPETRAERIASDREIAAEINAMDLTLADKLVLWKDRTGKGRQAYYDRLKGDDSGTIAVRPDYSLKDDLAERYDFFATDPATTRYLLDRESFDGPITEPCSGDGMIVEVLRERGYEVVASDLREHGVVGIGFSTSTTSTERSTS